MERALKSRSAFTVALTGLNKSAARFDSERVSKIIPDSRMSWKRAAALLDADIKGKSAFVTLPSLVCCEGISAAFHNRNSAHRVVFLPRNSATSLLSSPVPQNQAEPPEGEIKAHEQSFISKVSSITFHWS